MLSSVGFFSRRPVIFPQRLVLGPFPLFHVDVEFLFEKFFVGSGLLRGPPSSSVPA